MADWKHGTYSAYSYRKCRCFACKNAGKEYRQRPDQKANYKESTKRLNERRSKFLNRIKLAEGCIDCGYDFNPHALEFDHLPGTVKLFSIGAAKISVSEERLMAEIAKCEVVCANCHRIRTISRMRDSE